MSISFSLCLLALVFTLAICIYIACFISTVKGIIDNFRSNPPSNKSLYWKLAICLLFSTGFYCLTYFSCLFIESKKYISKDSFTFLSGANDKLFGLLFAAVIAQFLSSLFNRQQYEYQKERDRDSAKADKIEAVTAELTERLALRLTAMQNLVDKHLSANISTSLNNPISPRKRELEQLAAKALCRT